ncbi:MULTISPECIES: hypothetical protein [Enterococcus]|uniref:hypothetical protein n=1 Tax=Enterococcus TaxID=1350 RepID=UPI001D11E5FE|nr:MULTISPECIES: hypothetical protein [Enterococcus]MDU4526934.1 hypothetical protein [Enterococcus faecalis]
MDKAGLLSKANRSILVTVLGNVTEVIPLFEKALSAIVVIGVPFIESGITTSVPPSVASYPVIAPPETVKASSGVLLATVLSTTVESAFVSLSFKEIEAGALSFSTIFWSLLKR